MSLDRPLRRRPRVTLVPLIDVLFILLVYFMVTSVWRDLDMIPLLEGGDDIGASASAPVAGPGRVLLIRVDAGGRAMARGAPLESGTLDLAAAEGLRVMVLPSPEAPLSALVATLDRIAGAGVNRVELVRLEPR